ncbi:MAG TPA: DUF4142 domain-containing protein [Paucimonas sp.]|nr:DUF4142 domain-containing protein [Paucimonas sp.]
MSHRTSKLRPLSLAFGTAGMALLLSAAPVFGQSTSSSGTSSSDPSLSGQSQGQTGAMSGSTGTSSGTSGSTSSTPSGVAGSSGSTAGTTGTGASGTADTSGSSGTSGTAGTSGTSGTTGTGATGTTGTTGTTTPDASATTSSGATGTTGSTPTSPGAATDTTATGGGAYVPAGKPSVSASDRNLMRELAYANISEIEAAKVAQSKSKNDEVLNFARQMIDDHTQALDQLQQLAQQKNVQLPTEPNAKHKSMIKKLEAMSGDAFDREYLAKSGVSDHSQARKLVTRAKSRAQDADLKQLATNMESHINHHLQMARELRSGKATSTGSSGGEK